jgi:hypothetical protein
VPQVFVWAKSPAFAPPMVTAMFATGVAPVLPNCTDCAALATATG